VRHRRSLGHQGGQRAFQTTIATDGSVAAFTSFSDGLVPGAANGQPDVFVAPN
jgi:hypothetical protein